jgi:hypothetical protein
MVKLYEKTAVETAECLGAEAALLFVEFTNDAIDISNALIDAYDPDERIQSLVHHDFHALHQRIVGMQLDFLAGRYEAVRRELRFTWESIYRASLADCFRKLKPGDPNPPGPTVDDKADWLANPALRLDWNTAILPVLRHVFPSWSEDEVKAEFKPVWDRLNTAAHPSGEWRESGVGESARHVWHHFDESQAREVLDDARAVFAVVFAAVLTQFPKTATILTKNPHNFTACPQVRLLLPPSTTAPSQV